MMQRLPTFGWAGSLLGSRSLPREVRDDSPRRAWLAVTSDRVGIAERNDDLPFFELLSVAEGNRLQVLGLDFQDGDVEPRIGGSDRGFVRPFLNPDHVFGRLGVA